MKKVICLLTVILMVFASTVVVCAEDAMKVDVLVNGDRIVISGKVQVWEDTDVSLLVLNTGKNVSELTDDNVMEIVNYQNQTQTDADGNFVFDYEMSGVQGIYNFFIEVSGYRLHYSGSFEYFGSQYIAELLGQINTAKKIGSAETIKGLVESNLVLLNINTGHYRDYIAAKPEDAEIYLYAAKSEAVTDVGKLKEQLDDAALLLNIKYAADGGAAFAAIGALMTERFSESSAYATFRDNTVLTVEQQNEICRRYIGHEFYSVSAFWNAFSEDVLLTAANTAESYGELQRILISNKDLVNFENMAVYESLKNKEKVFIELFGTVFSSLADVKTRVDAAILTEKNIENKGGSGSTGESGGGGSRGGGSGFNSGSGAASISGFVPASKPAAKKGFIDMADFAWAKEAVDFLYDKKIVNGTGADCFSPGNFVTREEFLKMAIAAFDMYDETAEANFSDVTKEDWFYPYVASAAKRGVVKGVDAMRFGTGEKITREDMSVIVYRAANAAGIEFKSGNAEFTDSARMPGYAAEAVAALNASGIVRGMEDGRFGFGEYATRAQAAVIIYRLIGFSELAYEIGVE